MAETVQVTPFEVVCGPFDPIAETDLASWVIDQDMDQPDMCVLTLHNPEHKYTNDIELGAPVEVRVSPPEKRRPVVLFKGEVVGIEPIYKTGGETTCIVRAFNRLHRLLRGRNSRTYLQQKDSDIASTIASKNGLKADCDSTKEVHEHLYQHNQTDLEFLRVRAARNGYEVLVEDRTLKFQKPKLDQDSGVELRLDGTTGQGHELLSFTPRMSSAGLVQAVEVRGWDPVKKEEIVGKSTSSRSPLGKKPGASEVKRAWGQTVTYEVDHPIASIGEARAIADARLAELSMDYITGDGLCIGAPDVRAGIVVKVTVSPRKRDRFNGQYRVVGASHRYTHPTRSGLRGGYTTAVRVRRDAEEG